MTPFDRSRTSSCWRLLVNMATSCITSEIKRDFHPLHSMLSLGVPMDPHANICHKVWEGKLEFGVATDFKKLRMFILFGKIDNRDIHLDRGTDTA